MTKNEAEERAKRIWNAKLLQIEPRYNRGEWSVQTVDKVWHSLDGNGHCTCHEHCRRLEDKLP